MIYERWLDRKALTDDEWREARKQGIGGSDAAAVTGQNPYSSPLSVYYNKVGEIADKECTEAMRQGTDFEEYVANRFAEQTGKKVKKCNFVLRSKAHPFMLADIDRWVVGENAILECKTTQNRDGYTFSGTDYPMYWHCQCLHYMAVTGVERIYIAVLEFSRGFHIIELNRADHEEAINALVSLEEDFWNNYVAKGVPPHTDGTEPTTKALGALYPTGNEDAPTVDLMPYLTTVKRYLDIKVQIAELELGKTECENEIKAALGEACRGEYGGYKVTWNYSERTTIDSKKLKAEHPDLYALYSKTSGTRTFKLSATN